MSRGPFQFKSGKKPLSMKLRGNTLNQLQQALKIWEIEQNYPQTIPMRERIHMDATTAVAQRRKS